MDSQFNNNDYLSPLPISMTEMLREFDEDESSYPVQDGNFEESSQAEDTQ